MSFYHPEMTTYSPASKGKRPIDSVDLDDAGPPTKISRTGLGPESDFQQEGMSSAGHAASFVGVENLKADLKHRNSKYCVCIDVPEEQANLLIKLLHVVRPIVNDLI
jgi:hypothetical protein